MIIFSRFALAAVSILSVLSAPAHAAADGSKLKILHEFQRSDGDEPTFLLRTADGTLYGTTVLGAGADFGKGVLYKIDSGGNFSLVHIFTDTPDGALPGRLIQAADGSIYGLTPAGGAHSGGTVFRLDNTGTYSLLHSFDSPSEGSGPNFLIQASDGRFYGTNSAGGVPAPDCINHHANGTLFRMTANGHVTALHTFCEFTDGSIPSSLLQTADGQFYGTCREDGPLGVGDSDGSGTFWRANAAGSTTVLHVFQPQHLNGNEPTQPNGVVLAADGFFYGSANGGGGFSNGAIFRASADGHVTTLHPFNDYASDGGGPQTNLVLADDGYFYGTTRHGGLPIEDADRSGVVYRANTKGDVWVLHTFSVQDGMFPVAPPVRDPASKTIYTTATTGGANFNGVTGSFNEAKAIPVAKVVIHPDHVISGQSTMGTVKLSKPAPTGGQAVLLHASNGNVPVSVTVPAGDDSADFNIDTPALDFRYVTTITASIESLGASTTLTLLPSGPAR
jgi:uncharacterized repeat protein (TIGR03803 family)